MKYIDADILRKEIEFAKSVYSHPNRVTHGVADACRQDGRAAMCDDILKKIDSIQQEQPNAYEDAMLEVKKYVDKLYDNASIGLNEYDSGLYNGIVETCMKLRGFIKARTSRDQPEVDLEKEIEWEWVHREKQEVDLIECAEMDKEAFVRFARRFYELGFKRMDEVTHSMAVNLAAEKYADSIEGQEAFSYGADHYCWGDVNDAFLAGAKWMAEQGAQLIGRIKVNGMGQPYLPPEYIYLSGLELKEGDKVIVQIIKKEEIR